MEPLTVATYNVRHAVLDDGVDAWANRRAAVLDRIRAADPDVIGLQECGGDQAADVRAGLPGYEWAGIGDPTAGENNPVGCGPRVEVVDAGTVALSASGEPGSVGWDGDYPRVLTGTRLRDAATGRVFAAYNAHFDHVGTRARVESAAVVRGRIDGLDGDPPAVVLGDLNAEPGRDAYGRLTGDGYRRPLRDAREAADEVSGPATTLTDFAALRPGRRVDHVLVTPEFSVRRYAVDATTVDGRYPSDHLPVVVDLGYR